MAKKKYADVIISLDIKEMGGTQAAVYHGKDARGFDFGVQFSAIEPNSVVRDIPEIVDADRVATYFGGTPAEIGELGTEIEIKMGKKAEAHKIDSAAVIYIPKGEAFKETILRKPDKASWLYLITLPPKYVEPKNP